MASRATRSVDGFPPSFPTPTNLFRRPVLADIFCSTLDGLQGPLLHAGQPDSSIRDSIRDPRSRVGIHVVLLVLNRQTLHYIRGCGAMAASDGESLQRFEEEEESWENEVNMEVFYTEAAKYWKVRYTGS